MSRTLDLSSFAGREPERLSIAELRALHGKWAAFEVYSPDTNPPLVIVAMGESPGECAAELRRRGLDPLNHEYRMIRSPL